MDRCSGLRRASPFAALLFAVAVAGIPAQQPSPLPPGAKTIVNQDHFRSLVAMCVDTGEKEVQKGPRKISPTQVWVGEKDQLHKLNTGVGACDPAWSPDGRRIAVTDAEGLWVFPASSSDGRLRVVSKVPLGSPTEFTYRAFSHPDWSPDGALVALIVTNGGTSWVEVFEAGAGRLLYTSPPQTYSFSWSGPRQLKIGDNDVDLTNRR